MQSDEDGLLIDQQMGFQLSLRCLCQWRSLPLHTGGNKALKGFEISRKWRGGSPESISHTKSMEVMAERSDEHQYDPNQKINKEGTNQKQ